MTIFLGKMNTLRTMTTRSMSTVTKDAVEIIHDATKNVFRAVSRGDELGHLEFRLLTKHSRRMVDFFHTFTAPRAQGQGIAGRMVKEGLEWAKNSNYGVIPSCSYVAAYIQKNPQWKSSL